MPAPSDLLGPLARPSLQDVAATVVLWLWLQLWSWANSSSLCFEGTPRRYVALVTCSHTMYTVFTLPPCDLKVRRGGTWRRRSPRDRDKHSGEVGGKGAAFRYVGGMGFLPPFVLAAWLMPPPYAGESPHRAAAGRQGGAAGGPRAGPHAVRLHGPAGGGLRYGR